MQIGFYSPRPSLTGQINNALEILAQCTLTNLEIHRHDQYQTLFASLTDIPLDLLFFDMEGSDNPKDELEKLIQVIPHCALILLCDDARYALFGYAVHARDYLTLPLHPEDMVDVLTRFLRESQEDYESYLPLKMNGIWSRLNMRHITYIESAGHSLIFHMNDGRSFKIISSFSYYDNLIKLNRDFFRCHKSYVVNMRYVVGWELNNLTLHDGRTVNISRPYRQSTRSYYTCYATQSWDSPNWMPPDLQPEEAG